MNFYEKKYLKDICELKTGRNIDKKYHKDSGVPYITGASNIQKGIIVTDRFLDPTELKNLSYAVKGDIIVSCVGTLGKMGILKDEKAILSKHVFALTPKIPIDEMYFMTLVCYALIDCLPEKEEGVGGFSNKFDPEFLMEKSIEILDDDDQKWFVCSLVRFAILMVATNLESITSTDIRQAINMLANLQLRLKANIREQIECIDKLYDKLANCPGASEDDVNDILLPMLAGQRKQMNKLLSIL